MPKKVHELAKEMQTPSKDLIAILRGLGIEIKNHFTTLSDEQVGKVMKAAKGGGAALAEAAQAASTAGQALPKVRKRISAVPSEEHHTIKRIKKARKEEDQTEEETLEETTEEAAPEEAPAPEAAPVMEEESTPVSPAEPEVAEEAPAPAVEAPAQPEPEPVAAPAAVAAEPASQESKTERGEEKTTKKDKKRKPLPKEEEEEETEEAKEIRQKKASKKGAKKTVLIEDVEEDVVDDLDESEEAAVEAIIPVPVLRQLPQAKKKITKWSKKKEIPKKQQKKTKHTFNERRKDLIIGENISVGDLAALIGVKVPEIIRTLMSLGIMATITQNIDAETATLVAGEHGVEIKVQFKDVEDHIEQAEDKDEDLITRPPVVTIMGHVDHGKTSLLDKIRESDIAGGEAGGITQHIGAYHVATDHGEITFLDTPGHEAFTAMRARGADATDIVILVVAADDGPRPQTVEAIAHAKAAQVPILVAVNKCDKPDAKPEQCIQQLMEYELVAEDFGGDTPMIKVSAHTGEGIDKLLEVVLLQAELMELKANPDRMAEGVVIESRVEKGRGNVATILIQNGTLHIGDNYVVGSEFGRVRAMWNEHGKTLEEAGPAIPVEIVGLNGLPMAGDKFNVGTEEKMVRQIAESRYAKEKERQIANQQKLTLENIFANVGKEEKRILTLVIKADVIGSAEALRESLQRLGNEEVGINVIHSAVGAIARTDVMLAAASKAIIIGFNTRPDVSAKQTAQDEGVEIRTYSVIYEAIDDVTKALEGMLKPVVREEIQGKADVLEIYNIPKVGIIAGCKVAEGKVTKDSSVRVIRDHVIIHDGKLASLRRFKDAAKEVLEGFECGLSIQSYKDLRAGDGLEFYLRTESQGKL